MGMRVLGLVCLMWSLPCAAWEVRTDADGDLIRWNRPVRLVLDQRAAELIGEPLTEAAVHAALKTFDDATPFLDVSVSVGRAAPLGFVEGQPNQNSIVALEDWPFADNALAVTVVTLNPHTNQILDADVAINLASHKFRVLEEPAKEGPYDDVQNTVSHELGHVLSLMHNGTDPTLVMYPSASPGETSKRTLKPDDVDGLLALYGSPPPLFSCSSTGASPWLLLAALVLGLLRRGRQLVVIAAIPTVALAAEPDLALVKVTSRHSRAYPGNPGLIVTELSLSLVECRHGSCEGLTRAVVPGGRLGDLEQVVVHEPVPLVGQVVLVGRAGGRVKVVHLEGNPHEGTGVTHAK